MRSRPLRAAHARLPSAIVAGLSGRPFAAHPGAASAYHHITAEVLTGSGRGSAGYANALQDVELQTRAVETGGVDLDEDLAIPAHSPSPVSMEDLDRVSRALHLMPPGTEVRPLGPREYGLLAPEMQKPLRVTTDPEYYEANAESVEFRSLGNPLFQPPDLLPPATELPEDAIGTLRDLLGCSLKEQTAIPCCYPPSRT